MAQTATVYSFDIELAHVDRGVYESLAFRVAQHPSETDRGPPDPRPGLLPGYTDGIQFSSQGLSEPDEPPISVRDATGAIRAWIDIGVPDAARLHKASKAAPRVAVYTHKDPLRLVRLLEGERIHRRDALEIYPVDRDFLDAWVARLSRRMKFDLSISDGQIYLVLDEATLTGVVMPRQT